MKLNGQQIQEKAMEILEAHPEGMRWMEILNAVKLQAPENLHNTVHGAVHKLLKSRTDIVARPDRGFYRLSKYIAAEDAVANEREDQDVSVQVLAETPGAEPLTEKDFYESFAEWMEENDEATVASALGGASLGGKWGTPDVIGVLKPRAQDLFKFEPQIITAEIKAVPGQPVVAFGQAVAYRLFSHRSYIVVPKSTTSEDMGRLKSLCSIHGVGLVTFSLNKEQPDYLVVVLPVNASPDMFYVNVMLERLKLSEPDILNKLF